MLGPGFEPMNCCQRPPESTRLDFTAHRVRLLQCIDLFISIEDFEREREVPHKRSAQRGRKRHIYTHKSEMNEELACLYT